MACCLNVRRVSSSCCERSHNNALRGVCVQDDDVGMLGAAADEKRRLFVFLTVLAVLSFTC
jgi:hypothetical protein